VVLFWYYTHSQAGLSYPELRNSLTSLPSSNGLNGIVMWLLRLVILNMLPWLGRVGKARNMGLAAGRPTTTVQPLDLAESS
jgi:hypothetical protein